MKRIMFVCHGNICRSPMAEFILRRMLEERGVSHRFEVASSATSTEEIRNGVGNPVYPPARDELERHGISCRGKRAVLLSSADYPKYNLFIGMDNVNIRNMHRILGGDPEGKISRLMDYTSRPGEVSDPWYSHRFDITYRDISEGCDALLRALLKEETE